MLKVFFGSDRQQVVETAYQSAKKDSKSPVSIDEQKFYPGQFSELIGANSLFGEIGVYVIDTPSSTTEFFNECLDSLKEMAESPNHFIVIEGSLLAPAKKQFSKYAEQIEEFSADKPERFNVFGISEALARKDKKTVWLMVNEAFLLGIPEEEVIGILWWQLKALRLASLTTSASEAGMKEYPYRKAKQSLSKFSTTELNDLSHNLLSVYHKGHKGRVDLKLALERWVLTI